ncbi:HNH endonuclease signature motif containing protein [Morganella morganii]|uniref:HNH endonuclease signature motif containing protein n=1 Tax=Morganella morganii TaxID=582 RepID=UPI003EB79106
MSSWSEDEIQKVWEKGAITQYNPDKHRKDAKGAWILRSAYGDRSNMEGWEIDHITSKDSGGKDDLSNLRPLQWKNNVLKSNGRLKDANRVTSKGDVNIFIESDD